MLHADADSDGFSYDIAVLFLQDIVLSLPVEASFVFSIEQVFIFLSRQDRDLVCRPVQDVAGRTEEQIAVGTYIYRIVTGLIARGRRDGVGLGIAIAAGNFMLALDTDGVDRFIFREDAKAGLNCCAEVSVDRFTALVCFSGRIRRMVAVDLPRFAIRIAVASGRVAQDVEQADRAGCHIAVASDARSEDNRSQLGCAGCLPVKVYREVQRLFALADTRYVRFVHVDFHFDRPVLIQCRTAGFAA